MEYQSPTCIKERGKESMALHLIRVLFHLVQSACIFLFCIIFVVVHSAWMNATTGLSRFLAYRWRMLLGFAIVAYLIIIVIRPNILPNNLPSSISGRIPWAKNAGEKKNEMMYPIRIVKRNVSRKIFIDRVFSDDRFFSLEERITLDNPRKNQSLLLVYLLSSIGENNLRGCPDWNCKTTSDSSLLPEADAIVTGAFHLTINHTDQYHVFYSQESPIHSARLESDFLHFNFTFNYRHCSPASSPYGYTVHLATPSHRVWTAILEEVGVHVARKTKAVMWVVSHCTTHSHREDIFKALKKELPKMDNFGNCDGLECANGRNCYEQLDDNYFFYFAAENSICEDYITEKLWQNAFEHIVVPIVLRRRVVERLAPPHSFIAVDDFANVRQLANHLKYLMENREAYLEYFKWYMEYETVALNQNSDPSAERFWGMCQVCRLAQLRHRKTFIIESIKQYWSDSCDSENFAKKFLAGESGDVREEDIANEMIM